MTNNKFDDIAPLDDQDVKQTIQELLVDPGFIHAVKYILPDINWDDFSAEMSSYNTKKDFQSKMISPNVWALAASTSSSIDATNWENMGSDPHLIISNHRDIILDAGLLNILRHRQGYDTTEIAIGDNLLIHPWIEKLVRLNRSFLVKRGVSVRQMLEVSTHLSEYIHHTITDKHESVWLAQREGRAKDSNDRTQESVLKMLALSAPRDKFVERIKELSILPLAISYEYDPCDYLKAMEFQLKRDNPEYKKTQRDDLHNMEIGLLGFKGKIHFQFGECISDKLDHITAMTKKEQPSAIARIIDREIHKHYRMYPVNYIAHDLFHGTEIHTNQYSKIEVEEFKEYIKKQTDKIKMENMDNDFIYSKMLEMYSNPLKNHSIAKEE